ncbi:MAG TPA: hypothetical protein IAB90_00990 [Candidatus Coproplasma stercoripullorum]|uniref:Uncharacterized protein n=1 Tax=Candidatus Coproplasma stercoripullorum TaxID=2840751 RepID=A0A9D1AER0_9FIRM|nr:hypothetical protein [Candidatus Coproplasma stercoripullorum]
MSIKLCRNLGYKASLAGEDNRGNPRWGGFVLEAGDYEFRVQSDAHTQKTSAVEVTLGEDYIYAEDGTYEGAVGARLRPGGRIQ